MKKKYIIFSIVTLVLLITFVTCFNYFKTANNYVEDNVSKPTKITKGISMNLEQTAGAGDYKTVTQSRWPTDGYKFNEELSRCENGSELSWDDTKKAVIVSGNLSDKCYVYFDLARFDETCDANTLACHIAKLYTGTQGDNGIYYHDSSLTNGAEDNSYRYAGASDSVNNYICLGSDETMCPDDNLFRIIGIFENQTKVIKANSIGKKSWSSSNNTWSTSVLNTYLNEEYLTSLGMLSEKIATTTWKVGGLNGEFISSPSIVYQNEVRNNVLKTYDAKIGLMYLSDYGFAASPDAWSTELVDFNNSINDWLLLGTSEWSITSSSANTYTVFCVVSTGGVGTVTVKLLVNTREVRPTFSLLSSVTYASGDGTQSSPIRIN